MSLKLWPAVRVRDADSHLSFITAGTQETLLQDKYVE